LIVAGNSLAQFPHRGRTVPGSGFCELVTAHPYTIRYWIVRETMRVARVSYASRCPACH
jgi:plasmid stabilization system protein ParE